MKNSTPLYDKIFKTAIATSMVASAVVVVSPIDTLAQEGAEIFNDVKQTSDYHEYVTELFERGFVSGYTDGSFKPAGLLTRAHASKILALNLGLDVTKQFDYVFEDLSNDHWAYPYVSALKEAGVMDGFEDGTMRPNEPITRNQMAKIIVRGYGLQPTPSINLPFADIRANHWAAPYIQTLYNLGITLGQTATTYGGASTVTRANMAAFTIRSEKTVDYRENRQPDEKFISSIEGNKIVIGGQTYYIAKELQPLLHARNLAVLNEANLDFIKIGTKIIGIRNIELVNGGTAEKPLTLDLAGAAVEANITIAGDHIQLANATINGDITIKKGEQQQIELNGLNLNGRLIVEGEGKREQQSVIKLTNSTVNDLTINRDATKIVTDNTTPTITVGNHVFGVEVLGKIKDIIFNGNQDVTLAGTLQADNLTIGTPIKVTLMNKADVPSVEIQQYGSQLFLPKDSTIGTLIKPENITVEEAVALSTGGVPTIGETKNVSDVVKPPATNSSSGGGGGDRDSSTRFVGQTVTANNAVDKDNEDALAVGMIGTAVATSDAKVATAVLENGKINITSVGVGTAVIMVKEDAPSLKEAQITVTVERTGKISATIKRPLDIALEKINANPTPALADLVKLYDAADIKGVTLENGAAVTEAVKTATAEKGAPLIKDELALIVDIALLPEQVKKDNPSVNEVSTALNLQSVGPNGTAFTWKPVTAVDGATVDHTTGAVTRSANDDENDKVALYVTATNGTATKEAVIDATILEEKPPNLVRVIVQNQDMSNAISTGDTLTLIFSEPLSEVDRAKVLVDVFGANHPYGENAALTWTDNKTAVITLGTAPTVQFGTALAPNVADTKGNLFKDLGDTTWQSSAFQPQTNKETANDINSLGLEGTSAVTNNPQVATVAIVDGKVEISSVGAPGKATITVANGKNEAQIDVTVGLDGSVTVDKVIPYNPFVAQAFIANNVIDADNQDALAVGMIGTAVTTSDENVATAVVKDGKINITSVGVGTAVIMVKEDAPSLKEAQITVTVERTGKISATIKRPVEIALEKINANPTPALADLVKLYDAADIKGVTLENGAAVTEAVKTATAEKGAPLTKAELALIVDIALLPEQVKKDNPSVNEVSTALNLQSVGPNGTAFTWKPVTAVDGATVDYTTGAVTRSANDDENDKVALYVTATNGTATKEVTINATILEDKPPYLVSVTVNGQNDSKIISAGDEVTLLFSEPLSEDTRAMALVNLFGANHPYGSDAALGWPDEQTAVIKLGKNPTLAYGASLTPDVSDVNGNSYEDSGNTKWQSATFKQQTNSETNNLRDPLGMKGKSVSTNNPNVATAAIVDGKVEITSVGIPGKATITVSNGKDEAKIDVTVGLDGSVTIDKITPFTGDVKLDVLILETVSKASQGTWEEALLGAGPQAGGGPYNTDFPYIGDGQFLEAERFAKNGVYGGPELNDSDFTFKVASGQKRANDLDSTNFMKLLNASDSSTEEGIYRVHINEDGASMNATYFVDIFGKAGTSFAGFYQQFSYTTYGNDVTSVITARHNGAELQVVWDFKDLANIATQEIYLLKGDEWDQNAVPTGSPIHTVNDKTFEWSGEVKVDSAGNQILPNQDYTVVVVKKNSANEAIAYDRFNHYAINTKVTNLTTADTAAIDSVVTNLTDAIILKANPSLDEVTTALNLPSTFEGAKITWSATTADGATINPQTGEVTRSNQDDTDDTVTLTATMELDGKTEIKDFQVTIKESKTPAITDAVIEDANKDNQLASGDTIRLTFSEPIQSFDKLSIDGEEISVTGGTWNNERTVWEGTISQPINTSTVTVTNLQDQKGNETPSAQMNFTVAFVQAPTISQQPVAPNPIEQADGGTQPLTVIAATTDGGTLSYQWYEVTDGNSQGTPIAGSTGATYDAPITEAGAKTYYVEVTNTKDGQQAKSKSTNVMVTVKDTIKPTQSMSNSSTSPVGTLVTNAKITNEDGALYLVKMDAVADKVQGTDYNTTSSQVKVTEELTQAVLEELISSKNAAKVDAKKGAATSIDTTGLNEGIYRVIAVDKSGNVSLGFTGNTVKLENPSTVVLEAMLSQTAFTGDFHYNSNDVISSEAVDSLEQVLQSATVKQGNQAVVATNIRYDASNVISGSGSIESGTFQLNSIQATVNGQEETIALKNNVPISVATSKLLKVKAADEVINGVISKQVSNGYVDTVAVADSVTSTIDTATLLTLSKSVTLDGKGKLKVGAVWISAQEVIVNNLEVTGSQTSSSSHRSAIKINGSANRVALNDVRVNHVRGGGFSYSALNILKDDVELTIVNSDIRGQYDFGGNNTDQPAYGIYSPFKNIKITSENSTITGLHVHATDLRGAYGILVGENAELDIKNSTIEAYGGGGYTQAIVGIHLGNGSKLNINRSKIKVTAKNARAAYGIFNAGTDITVNIDPTNTTFDLIADERKEKVDVKDSN